MHAAVALGSHEICLPPACRVFKGRHARLFSNRITPRLVALAVQARQGPDQFPLVAAADDRAAASSTIPSARSPASKACSARRSSATSSSPPSNGRTASVPQLNQPENWGLGDQPLEERLLCRARWDMASGVGGGMNVEQAVFLVGGLGSRLHGADGRHRQADPRRRRPAVPRPPAGRSQPARHQARPAALRLSRRRSHARLPGTHDSRHDASRRWSRASPAGTAGALALAADRLDEDFFLVNGDSLFDFNWLALCPPATTSDRPGAHGAGQRHRRRALWTGRRRWPEGADFRRIRRPRTSRSMPASISCARRSCRGSVQRPARSSAMCCRDWRRRPDRGLRRRGAVHRYRHPRGLRARASPRSLHPEAARRLSRPRRRAERGHGLRSPPRPGPLGRRRARSRALAERRRLLRVHRHQPGRCRARPLQRRPRRTICTTG